MKQTEKVGTDQYWDAATECASAVLLSTGTVLSAMSAQPWAAAALGFNAITSSTACIAKITSIASGQTVGQYTQLSGAMTLLDPWGQLLAVGTGGGTLSNSAPANVFASGQSLTETLYEKLTRPSKFKKAEYFQIAADLIRYASSSADVNPREGRLLGVSLLDKSDEKPIHLDDVSSPEGKEE